jgi:hypothetical protein
MRDMPMRRFLPLLVLTVALLAAHPVQAQLRAEAPGKPAPVAVYDQPASGFALGQLFDSEAFRLSHSYEFSYNSFAGEGIGVGVYTTSLRYQPTDRLAARVDLGVAHSPFGSNDLQQQLGFSEDQPARVFLRNASLAYRPTENSLLTLSFQRSPYGGYYGHGAGPMGYSPFYGGNSFHATVAGQDHGAMFWRTVPR